MWGTQPGEGGSRDGHSADTAGQRPSNTVGVQSVSSLASGGSSGILPGADLWYNCGLVPGGGASESGFLILPPTPENILIIVGGKKGFFINQ